MNVLSYSLLKLDKYTIVNLQAIIINNIIECILLFSFQVNNLKPVKHVYMYIQTHSLNIHIHIRLCSVFFFNVIATSFYFSFSITYIYIHTSSCHVTYSQTACKKKKRWNMTLLWKKKEEKSSFPLDNEWCD